MGNSENDSLVFTRDRNVSIEQEIVSRENENNPDLAAYREAESNKLIAAILLAKESRENDWKDRAESSIKSKNSCCCSIL